MATTEELDLVIKTVGDTSGAEKVTQSLQDTQKAAGSMQQQLTAGQAGANAAMRAIMAQNQATLENFNKIRQAVQQQLGVAPTLRPEAFGIQLAAAAAVPRAAAAATSEVGKSAREVTAA